MKTPDEQTAEQTNQLQTRRKTRAQAAPLYPIFLQGAGLNALVVGAGAVGLRKIERLLQSQIHVTVVEPEVSSKLKTILQAQKEKMILYPEAFNPNRFSKANFNLVFSCTNDPACNTAVREWANGKGILINAADDPEHSDFANGATLQHEGTTIVISSNGSSPAKTAKLKRLLEGFLSLKKAT